MKNIKEWKIVKTVMDWKIVQMGFDFGDFLRPMNITLHAAYTTFYLALSVFPVLVILFGVLGYTSVGVEELMVLVESFLPEAFVPMAERLLRGAYEHTSGAVVSVSALAALWSAGRGVRGLLLGLNAAYGMKENRNYFVTRGIGMVYSLLFVMMLVLTLVLYVFGTTILDYLQMTTIPILQFLMSIIDLRYVFLLVLQTALFTAMYAVLPNRHNTLKESLPGALLTSLGWLIYSNLYSIYVVYFSKYSNIFGSVYAVALAMVWLYWCICIIFYGAVLNRIIMEKKFIFSPQFFSKMEKKR